MRHELSTHAAAEAQRAVERATHSIAAANAPSSAAVAQLVARLDVAEAGRADSDARVAALAAKLDAQAEAAEALEKAVHASADDAAARAGVAAGSDAAAAELASVAAKVAGMEAQLSVLAAKLEAQALAGRGAGTPTAAPEGRVARIIKLEGKVDAQLAAVDARMRELCGKQEALEQQQQQQQQQVVGAAQATSNAVEAVVPGAATAEQLAELTTHVEALQKYHAATVPSPANAAAAAVAPERLAGLQEELQKTAAAVQCMEERLGDVEARNPRSAVVPPPAISDPDAAAKLASVQERVNALEQQVNEGLASAAGAAMAAGSGTTPAGVAAVEVDAKFVEVTRRVDTMQDKMSSVLKVMVERIKALEARPASSPPADGDLLPHAAMPLETDARLAEITQRIKAIEERPALQSTPVSSGPVSAASPEAGAKVAEISQRMDSLQEKTSAVVKVMVERIKAIEAKAASLPPTAAESASAATSSEMDAKLVGITERINAIEEKSTSLQPGPLAHGGAAAAPAEAEAKLAAMQQRIDALQEKTAGAVQAMVARIKAFETNPPAAAHAPGTDPGTVAAVQSRMDNMEAQLKDGLASVSAAAGATAAAAVAGELAAVQRSVADLQAQVQEVAAAGPPAAAAVAPPEGSADLAAVNSRVEAMQADVAERVNALQVKISSVLQLLVQRVKALETKGT